jgi:quercetin dioxygenase-like cupin family protein/DNA-binding XRE family transcriptional regulator
MAAGPFSSITFALGKYMVFCRDRTLVGTKSERLFVSSAMVGIMMQREEPDAGLGLSSMDADDAIRIGAKLRYTRLLRCLSLRELATAAGCSESFVSKIENGKAQPSLSMLRKIVKVLGTDLTDIFIPPEGGSDQVKIVRAGASANFKADARTNAKGITMIRLSPSEQGSLLQTMIHVVPPGASVNNDFTHNGEEIAYVLTGEIEFTVDGDKYLLHEGDSIFYPSHLPHGYINKGNVEVRILWTSTPPTWRKQLRPLN